MKACPFCGLRYPNESTLCFVDGKTLEPWVDTLLGMVIAGRYALEQRIGEGGMATVYKARRLPSEKVCAVKVLSPVVANNPIARERFRREARAAQRLVHPNVIEILDAGDTEDGTPFLVMELLRGEDLAQRISRGRLTVHQILPIMLQVSRALARAHDFGVIHRDLKPENIFLHGLEDQEKIVKLLDFGIAKSSRETRLTYMGELFGTPQYMAPERVSSKEAGPSADLYSLGVVLFELLTGRLPFLAKDIPTLFAQHIKDAPPSLAPLMTEAIPPLLDALVMQLLAKDPEQRPVDAHRVRMELTSLCEESAVPVPDEPVLDLKESFRPGTLQPHYVSERLQEMQHLLQTLPASSEQSAEIATSVHDLVNQLEGVDKAMMAEFHRLSTVERKGKEGRIRFGTAMDALGQDASKARAELRTIQEDIGEQSRKLVETQEKIVLLHKDILFWEGRSGFVHFHREMAHSYREVANCVDSWNDTYEHKKNISEQVNEKEQAVSDIKFQIQGLRDGLSRFESEIDDEKKVYEEQIGQLKQNADELLREMDIRLERLRLPAEGHVPLQREFERLKKRFPGALSLLHDEKTATA